MIPPTTEDHLVAMSLAQRDELADALLDVTTTADLEAWLAAHPPDPDCIDE